MLDFNHILNTPGVDIQYFYGDTSTTLVQWKTWIKPRGVKFVYIMAVGGGSGGGNGLNSATTSGGGPGGGSGAQSACLLPAQFVPNTLYIQAGNGGLGASTTAGTGAAGTISYVCAEPNTTLAAALTMCFAELMQRTCVTATLAKQ